MNRNSKKMTLERSILRQIQFFFILLVGLSASAQITFNKVQPVSWQDPPFNYAPNGYLTNVFEIDRTNNFYDGYLCFGLGVLCRPGVCDNYTRSFSIKTNLQGELMWWNRYDNDSIDMNDRIFSYQYQGMCINHRGNFLGMLTQYSVSDPLGLSNIDYLSEFKWDGTELLRTLVDTSFVKYNPYAIVEDFMDSTYIVCGWIQDSLAAVNNTEPDGYIMKLDTLGNVIWESSFTNTFAIISVYPDSGGYWLVGQQRLGSCLSSSTDLNENCIIIYVDSVGIEQDRKVLHGSCGWEHAKIIRSDEGLILGGMLTNPIYDPNCAANAGYLYSRGIVFNHLTGHIEYVGMNKQYNHICPEQYFADFKSTLDSGYVFGGWMRSAPLPYQKASLMKLDANRDSVWHRQYIYYVNADSFTEHYLTSIALTSDSGFVCAGYASQGYVGVPNPGLDVPWIFKTDQFGCLEPGCQLVAVDEIVIGLENSMSVFPNPVSSSCNIQWNIDNAAQLEKDFGNSTLIITDITGREMHRQNLSHIGNGQTISIDMSSYTAGIYMAHWVSGTTWLDSLKVVKE